MNDLTRQGDIIRQKREALGWSQGDLANAARQFTKRLVKQQTVQRIETGETQHSRITPALLMALGLQKPNEIGARNLLRLPAPNPGSAEADTPQDHDDTLSEEIPIKFVADGIEGAFEFHDASFGFVDRPKALAGAPGVYAVYMRGLSMSPMYRSGDLLTVSPFLPPRVGDGALFFSADRKNVYIAEFMGETEAAWNCKLWGERPREFSLQKKDFPFCECVYSIRKRP